MRREEVDKIVERLPSGRTLFYYFRDRYALLLLDRVVVETYSIAHLKSTQFAPLLRKPLIKQRLALCGGGKFTRSSSADYWPEDAVAYRLTVGRWPNKQEKWQRSWHQMARPGQNLVLQLNFSRSDQRRLARLVGDWDLHPGDSHPVAKPPELTLAWARLDIDQQQGEALIEELQSDWANDRSIFEQSGQPSDRDNQRDQRVLRQHYRIWQEAMLAATIEFVTSELGLQRIFLYDYQTGLRLKGLTGHYNKPPRSLYSRLPKKFCFRPTAASPLFLRSERSRWLRRELVRDESRWWVLELPKKRVSTAVFHQLTSPRTDRGNAELTPSLAE